MIVTSHNFLSGFAVADYLIAVIAVIYKRELKTNISKVLRSSFTGLKKYLKFDGVLLSGMQIIKKIIRVLSVLSRFYCRVAEFCCRALEFYCQVFLIIFKKGVLMSHTKKI